MQVIQKAANIMELGVGEQKIAINKMYRLLKFVLMDNCADGVLLFNNLTKEFLLLSEEEAANLKSNTLKLDTELLLTLAKKWFLVPLNNDDAKISQQITSFKRQLLNIDNVIDNFTILTTTACNARCFYCFEAGAKPVVMTEKIAVDVAKFVIDKSNNYPIDICWFGGEPLCNKKVIDNIVDMLIEKNVTFRSTMISNGYLFNENLAKSAFEKWNLKNVQITLDGTEEVYNRVKNYVYKDTNAFEHVVNNIGILLKNNISVFVRLNMDKHNSKDLFDLVDCLYTLYGQEKGFSVYAHLLFENKGFEKVSHTEVERQRLGENFIELCNYIKAKGIWAHKEWLRCDVRANHCMADNPKSLVIFPNGKIGRCECFLEDKFIGDIYTHFEKSIWTHYYKPLSKCKDCPCYPDCMSLKDCPNCHEGCYDFEQTEKILRLKDLMQMHYEKNRNQ